MRPVLLIDFGSTYTKVTAVDTEAEVLLGTAAAYTTVQTDINEGLSHALEKLEAQTGKLDFAARYACSSAAGGLRMIASGLVPELTSEAAKQASLGAGAKIVKVYSFELTEDDIEEIDRLRPDIFLLVGGTDGGNSDCIRHNAQMLAACKKADFPVIIAGNRTAARACQRSLEGRQTFICENVMPKFGVLNIQPAQECIRALFLNRIIQAKGLSHASKLISGILMPTPSAMMRAMQLLAEGCEGEEGIGELMALDVGGATTDVYSIADGMPKEGGTVYKGLPEPYVKRTVEGDIGMRYSIGGIVEAASLKKVASLAGLTPERAQALIDDLAKHTEKVPDSEETERLDFALACCACETAARRHAGYMEETYNMTGKVFVQTGKDLRTVRQMVVTGGSLIHTRRTGEIASHAFYDPADPMSLRPIKARVLVDRRYILAAMGLLSEYEPQTALRIMKKELKPEDGYSE